MDGAALTRQWPLDVCGDARSRSHRGSSWGALLVEQWHGILSSSLRMSQTWKSLIARTQFHFPTCLVLGKKGVLHKGPKLPLQQSCSGSQSLGWMCSRVVATRGQLACSQQSVTRQRGTCSVAILKCMACFPISRALYGFLRNKNE